MYECDIVFLFDTSGSMGDYISKVKNVVENFTNDLQNYDVDYRLGIVTFEYDVQTYEFTDDVGKFKNTVDTILNTGGSYEYGLTAIEEALKMNFRSNVGKYFIMLTDEPYEESSSKSTEIINQLKSNNVRLDVIGLSGYSCNTYYKPITDATGGGFYDINGHMKKIFQNIIVGANIPSNALDYKGHSYAVYSDVVNTWEEAKIYCENQGGYLAVINNSSENQAIYNYITELGYKNAYFGLTDSKKEGTWEWSTGEYANYTNWGNIEPNSERSDEDYAEFYYKYTDGKWNDGNFGNGTVGDSKTFICEWDTTKNSKNNNANGGNENSNSFFRNLTITKPIGEEKKQLYERSTRALSNLIKLNGDDIVLRNSEGIETLSEYISSKTKEVTGSSPPDIKQSESVFRLIGNLSGFTEIVLIADLIASARSIIDCLNHRTVDKQFGENLFNESKNLLKVTNDLAKLQDNSFVKSLGLGFGSALCGLAAVAIASYDDIKSLNITEKEQDDLVKNLINVVGEAIKFCNPELAIPVVGTVDVVSAAAVGIYMGNVTYQRSLDEYSKDGYLSLGDKRDANIDALMSGLYGFTHKITYEVDDIFFEMIDEVSGNKYKNMSYDQKAAGGLKLIFRWLDEKVSNTVWNGVKNIIGDWVNNLPKSSSNSSTLNEEVFYNYIGGKKAISDYVSGEKIEFRSDYSGFDFTDRDFKLKSGSGDLTIKNARDKIMDVAVNGNTVAYAYMASGSGEINGSGLSPLEVIIGGNNLANQIIAGSGGSSLWGGAGGNDVLTGNSGQDNFFYGKNDGSDVINNASSNDIVYLYDVSLSDITTATTSGNKISVTFNTGNNLQINSTENLSPTFNLSDGNWKFNHSSGQWQGS